MANAKLAMVADRTSRTWLCRGWLQHRGQPPRWGSCSESNGFVHSPTRRRGPKQARQSGGRYERLKDIIDLAIHRQAAWHDLFKAGGTHEMCWHLFTWGDSIAVEKPVRLRQQLAKMCDALPGHHGSFGKDKP